MVDKKVFKKDLFEFIKYNHVCHHINTHVAIKPKKDNMNKT